MSDTYASLAKHIESNGKIDFEKELRYKHKNGSQVWVLCTANVYLHDSENKPMKMI